MTDSTITPDKELMLSHVAHLFGDCIEDGLIELAWTGPRDEDREVCYAQHFDVSDYHELVDRAFEINRFYGNNVYIGAGLRKASTQKGMRTKDAHIQMLPALYVDLDKPGIAEAAKEKVKNIQPTFIVTTGRIPNLRQQLWWKLDEPIRDFAQSTDQIRAITEALGGDSSISNPSRVMRLAGSVAYPKKEGRVTEETQAEQPHNYPFPFEVFGKAFPIMRLSERPAPTTDAAAPATSNLNLPDPLGMRVLDCVRDVHVAGQWHKNVLRLTAHWVRCGLTTPIVLKYGRRLFGAGDVSAIQAREAPYSDIELPEYPSDFNAIEIVEGYCTIQDLRIVGGATGIMLYGRDSPCVKNVIENVSIWDCINGMTFDGWNDTNKPCYWNNASRVLISRPQLNGVLFTITPGNWDDPDTFGDSPNANKLHDVRVYSLSAPMGGCGFFISAGRYNNSFFDCEANVHPSALACFRLGFSTDNNQIVNFYAESLGLAPGIQIDNGSTNTSIVNLFSATGGAAIWDPTLHGEYQAYNAGFPVRNYLKKAQLEDVHIEGMTRATTFIDPPEEHEGAVNIDLQHTFYLLSSFNKPYDLILPNAADAVGRWVSLKKSDLRENPITIKEEDGLGPDRREVVLLQQFDSLTLVSNGANWWILQDNRTPALSAFVDRSDHPSGVYEANMLHRVYLVSAFTGQIIFQLPAPSAAPGRLATIKKIDPSSNAVKIQMVAASGGPDSQIWSLTGHFAAMTIFSDGGQWVVLSSYG